ncbi:MAG: exodeoxyribonuclease VII small subunit [candidate division KSB1 bacterium]|nr:exodeoxyribonuclease VII small subunit [candidate division KSB1 bacterium]
MAGKKSEPRSFESAMQRLEEIAAALEAGDLPLEESLRLFEEGMELSRYCASRLEEAEQRLKRLVRREGGFALEDME